MNSRLDLLSELINNLSDFENGKLSKVLNVIKQLADNIKDTTKLEIRVNNHNYFRKNIIISLESNIVN